MVFLFNINRSIASALLLLFYTSSKSIAAEETTLIDPYITNDFGDTWVVTSKKENDKDMSRLPSTLGLHTATSISIDGDTKIFIMGGCAGRLNYVDLSVIGGVAVRWPWLCTEVSDAFYVYDPKNDSYRTLAPMHGGRYGHTAVEVDGKIWVAGGRRKDASNTGDSHDTIIKFVDVYDIEKNTWLTLSGFDAATANGASFSLRGDHFYYAGGFDDEYKATEKMYLIDCGLSLVGNTVSYTEAASMNTPRGFFSAVVINHAAVVSGGAYDSHYCTTTKSAEYYNPYAVDRKGNPIDKRFENFEDIQDVQEDIWQPLNNLENSGGSAAMSVINDQVLTFGGVRNDDCKKDFDAMTNVNGLDWLDYNKKIAWYEHGVIPEERSSYTAASVPELNSVFIMGGMSYYDESCHCMETMGRVTKYYLLDPALLNFQTIPQYTEAAVGSMIFAGFSFVVLLVMAAVYKFGSKNTGDVEPASFMPTVETSNKGEPEELATIL